MSAKRKTSARKVKAALAPTPVLPMQMAIADSKPLQYDNLGVQMDFGYGYEAAYWWSPERDWGFPYNVSTPEDRIANTGKRNLIGSRLRDSLRNSDTLAAIFECYLEGIGTPHFQAEADSGDSEADEQTNWDIEDYMHDFEDDMSLEGGDKHEVVRLLAIELFICGDAFITFTANGQIQQIPAYHIGSGETNNPPTPAGMVETAGVITDGAGKRMFYRVASINTDGMPTFEKTTLIPADNMFQLITKTQIGQRRGITALAAMMKALKDLDEIDFAMLLKVKSAAFHALFIATQSPQNTPAGFIDPSLPAEVQQVFHNYQEMRAGGTYYGNKGEQAQLLQGTGTFADFHEYIHRRIKKALSPLGIPLGILLRDYDGANYAGQRGIATLWENRLDKTERPKFNRVFKWIYKKKLKWAGPQVTGALEDDYSKNFKILWSPHPIIDRQREAATNAINLANGTDTLQDIFGRQGRDWRKAQDQRDAEIKRAMVKAKAGGYDVRLLLPQAVVNVTIDTNDKQSGGGGKAPGAASGAEALPSEGKAGN